MLKYVIQWETPVSSQIATRDLGRMLFQPLYLGPTTQGDYFNPRYQGYAPLVLKVDYGDVVYNESSLFPVLFDGNGDGKYTAVMGSHYNYPTPDLNDNNVLELNEDYGLDTYPYTTYDVDGKVVYSRPVSIALDNNNAFGGSWPENIANRSEATEYWDVRESVRLYDNALDNIPDLEAMFLLSVEDHVQSDPFKSHVHQAYDGWTASGIKWFKINPSKDYILAVDPNLEEEGIFIPDLNANTAPADWEDVESYCISEYIADEVYQIAAVHQMADRVQDKY